MLEWKSGLRFWIPAPEVPFSGTWKWALLAFSGARKWDFKRPNPKTETTFSRQHTPKMVELPFTTFGRVFSPFWNIVIFRPFLGHFPISTDQIKNLWRHRSNMKSKRWKWVFWSPHTYRQWVLSWQVAKHILSFKWHPSPHSQIFLIPPLGSVAQTCWVVPLNKCPSTTTGIMLLPCCLLWL